MNMASGISVPDCDRTPAPAPDPVVTTRIALKPGAAHHRTGRRDRLLDELIAPLMRNINPRLIDASGVGIEIAA
jgi:hypothetical protein